MYTVAENISDDHILIADSQEVTHILRTIGYEGAAQDYGVLFVKLDQTGTEYAEVRGYEGNTPYDWSPLDRLL